MKKDIGRNIGNKMEGLYYNALVPGMHRISAN
jgi:hypothetical protein